MFTHTTRRVYELLHKDFVLLYNDVATVLHVTKMSLGFVYDYQHLSFLLRITEKFKLKETS